MSCGCTGNVTSSFDGDSFEGETPSFVPDLNFQDLDNLDDGSMDFRFNDDGEEYDDFLTKRSRARLKRRRALRKSGLSRKEAKAQAKKEIPKQKLGSLIKNVLKGKTSEETKGLIANAGAGQKVVEVPPVEQSGETGEVPSGMGGTPDMTMGGQAMPVQAGFMAKNKTMLIVAGVGVALIGGYFLLGKKLGIR